MKSTRKMLAIIVSLVLIAMPLNAIATYTEMLDESASSQKLSPKEINIDEDSLTDEQQPELQEDTKSDEQPVDPQENQVLMLNDNSENADVAKYSDNDGGSWTNVTTLKAAFDALHQELQER